MRGRSREWSAGPSQASKAQRSSNQVAGNAGVACPALRDTGPQGKDHHTTIINTNRNGKEILIKGHALASSSWICNFCPLHDLWLGAWLPWEGAQMTSGHPTAPGMSPLRWIQRMERPGCSDEAS